MFTLGLVVGLGGIHSVLHAQEEQPNNKLLLFLDPSETFPPIVVQFMQYWTLHPNIDATLVMRDVPQKDLDAFKKKMLSDEDDPAEERRFKRWAVQEEVVKKDGTLDKILNFMQSYHDMELANLTPAEKNNIRFEPVMDRGNALAKQFRVSTADYPVLIVANVETKRVTRYPLPEQFSRAVKDLDYLLNLTLDDLKN